MTRQQLQDLLQKGPIILDGATGSNLMAKGMPMGVCPEDWIFHHKDAIVSLQKAYVEAGTQILYAPTFTANRIKLAEYGMEDRLEELNRAMVRFCREAAGDSAFVAADLTMTGQQMYPVGDLMFEDLVTVYKEQLQAILKEGVDLVVIETMMSLQECRAALLAVKETCDLPVMISLTYNEDGRTLYGTSPETAMVVLEHMGADVVGINCSTGPEAMIPLVKAMVPYADIPILVKPNAGMPELEQGETVYKMTPEEFADSSAAVGFAPTVVTSTSTIASLSCNPTSLAACNTVLICSFFSSRSFGRPACDSGSSTNIAPYFFAIGRSASIFSFSQEMELIKALPG
jgi:5-methyltetrahydrofolate--homocysteine methyltransferase